MNSFSLAPNRQKMAICCKELDSIKDIFNEKEKELAVAMSKVDALTRQLDELKDGNTMNSYNINMTNSSVNALLNCQPSKFNIELEKLKQELLYRTKLNEKINEEMLIKQKQIDQRTSELNNIDQRIAELKNRLTKKRNLNKQLNDQMKNHLLKTENNQSKTLNDNLNNENDVPNCNSILKLNLRRSIGAGQPYKFTHLKQQNQILKSFNAVDLKRQPKSDLNLNTKLIKPVTIDSSSNISNKLNEQKINKSNFNNKINLNDNQSKISTIQNQPQQEETKLITSINVNNEQISDQNLLNNNQRLNAITNTAKYLIVDQRQKELVVNLNEHNSNEHNSNEHNLNEHNKEYFKNDNLNDNFKNNLNSNFKDKFKLNDNVNNNLKINLNNSSLNNEQLNNSTNISPTISTASSSNLSTDFVTTSNSDIQFISSTNNSTYSYPPPHKLNLVYYQTVLRFTNVQPIIRDDIENASKSVKQLKQNIEQSNQESSINNLLINSKAPLITNQQNVFNTSNSDNNKLNNNLIVQTKQQINKPDIIESSNVNTEDNTDFINSSSCNSIKTDLITKDSINNSDLTIDHFKSNSTDNDKNQQFNFGLLQTSTSTSSNKSNNTDSESDLSSETSTNISYKKSSTNLINKNNELNDNNLKLSNSFSNDLKISIDNSDWLRKRRPLIGDLDLEEHFDKINDQLVYNSTTDKFNNNEQSNKDDNHLNNKTDKKIDNLDMLSTSSSSNHSPNSLVDELDANKIELRSVIRNIMCKNLGSSSDKSSTMSEEEETDEDDENSVDCKAKINNIKPSSMKLKQSTNQNNNRINTDDNELNKSKEMSNHNSNILKNNKLNLNDQYNDSADDKDSDNQYDSNNSEERTDELSSKDDLTTTNNLINDNHLKSNKIKSKSNLKKQSNKNKRRVSFDPLAILLDAALEGELDLVKKTASQVSNPSASFEGVTALHNSICAGHFEICTYLIQIGCDVNAQDHDGWTPLHCAASVGNLPIIKYLVEHGACIFSVTLSDHETPKQKCEEQEDGFEGCFNYLQCMEEKLGTINGTVYAAYDYTAQQSDELSFKCNEQLRILDRSDDNGEESEWYFASNSKQMKGYIPRNLIGLYPRLIPMPKENYDD